MRHFNYDEVAVGDYIEVMIHNEQGDRNLDRGILRGTVVEKTDPHRQLRLDSGWCCHEKDELLGHRPLKEGNRG